MASKKKGKTNIHIYPDWCKGCGLCAAFCPAGVLELDASGKAFAAREEECINCGYCELHCPDFAIVLTSKDKKKAEEPASVEEE